MAYSIDKCTLENHLSIFYGPYNSEDVSIVAMAGAGPLYENRSNDGISHIIEHLLFRGTKNRRTYREILKAFDKLGGKNGAYINSNNVEVYACAVPGDFSNAAELLSDILFNSKMMTEDIAKEKQIVLNEIQMRNDEPSTAIWDRFIENISTDWVAFSGGAGNPLTVEALKSDEIREFYKKAFNPGNIQIIVCGSIPEEEAFSAIGEHFSSAKSIGKMPVLMKYEPIKSNKEVLIEKEIDNAYTMMGKPLPNLSLEELFAIEIAAGAASHSLFERMVVQEAFSHTVFATPLDFGCINAFLMYSEYNRENHSKAAAVIEEELARASEGMLKEEDILDEIEEEKKAFILDNTTTYERAKSCSRFMLKGNINDINNFLPYLERVTPEEVSAVAKKYLSTAPTLSVSIGKI
ncbi:MAG: pitrilysin family protein [Candidatus Woesearchaeota archaeon]|nr:pitrilysin family protein [Candidatus Woesearchaeota archaeon]